MSCKVVQSFTSNDYEYHDVQESMQSHSWQRGTSIQCSTSLCNTVNVGPCVQDGMVLVLCADRP